MVFRPSGIGAADVIVLARAKINWALQCAGSLPQGMHELDMLMESVSLEDELELLPGDKLCLLQDGQPAGEENLVFRAAKALQDTAGTRQGACMKLTKRIPQRAGLGGGSADCAAALAGLNQMWDLHMDMRTLSRLGFSLGADVPFCLEGGLCRAKGRGERLTKLHSNANCCVLIAMDGAGLSTKDVFQRFDGQKRSWTGDMERAQSAVIARDVSNMEQWAQNALYAPACELDHSPQRIVSDMYACGARFARMSGSGAAVFGVFERENIPVEAFRSRYGFCEICETTEKGWVIR